MLFRTIANLLFWRMQLQSYLINQQSAAVESVTVIRDRETRTSRSVAPLSPRPPRPPSTPRYRSAHISLVSVVGRGG
jgi:hypothetical protein